MKLFKGNTVIVGALPSEKVSIECPPRPSYLRVNKSTLPTCKIVGEGKAAEVVVKWDIVPFWRSKYYVDRIPELWKIIRQVYDLDGNLIKPEIVEMAGYAVKEGTGLIFSPVHHQNSETLPLHPGATFPGAFTEKIEGQEEFVFPTKLNPYWRLHFFIRRTDKPRFPVVDGYFQFFRYEDEWPDFHDEAEEFPTRDDIARVIELWKIRRPRKWRYVASFVSRTGRLPEIFVWELSIENNNKKEG